MASASSRPAAAAASADAAHVVRDDLADVAAEIAELRELFASAAERAEVRVEAARRASLIAALAAGRDGHVVGDVGEALRDLLCIAESHGPEAGIEGEQ